MSTIYISGPLQSVDNLAEMRRFYEFLAEVCRDCGFCSYLPHVNTDPDAHRHLSSVEVFVRDMDALKAADIVVAYIGLASSGVGAELGLAVSRQTRIVALYNEEDSPSRFLLGMLEASDCAVTIRFQNREQCRTL